MQSPIRVLFLSHSHFALRWDADRCSTSDDALGIAVHSCALRVSVQAPCEPAGRTFAHAPRFLQYSARWKLAAHEGQRVRHLRVQPASA